MKKMLFAVMLITVPVTSIAGFYGPTSHSRANCAGFNESISWWAGHPDYRRAVSFHFRTARHSHPAHSLDTGMYRTFRAAAYHATEAYSSQGHEWKVVGGHYYLEGREQKLGAVTEAINCNIYDGWWDQ